MRKLRTLLTLLVVNMCAVQSAWADRVAPELPAAVAPVSGQAYYLYNVMEEKFLSRSTSGTAYPGIATYGEKIKITATANEGEYKIQFASNNYYFVAADSYISSQSSGNNKGNYFTIAESSKGYTIQRSPSNTTYYKDDEFIGYNGNNGDRLNPQLAEGSIHWLFIPVDDAEHYFAKHKLYTYLETADYYNFYTTQYELVYNDENSTTAQLNLAQETLNDALSMSSNFVSPDWTDYPILFQNNTDNKWTLYNGELRWRNYKVSEMRTSTLMGTVNVDEDVTLVYTYKGGNNFTNLRVYLDGELIQSVTAIEGQKNRNYYIEMSPGKHDIAWTCVFNGSSTTASYEYASYLSKIGIEITPTLTTEQMSVEGQLGTEVLKQTDHVKNVRKLVVNGAIGSDDWANIDLMTNLFSIDLTNADFTEVPANQFKKSKFTFLHSVKLPASVKAIGNYAFDGSDIDDIQFPSELESIGNYAFRETKIQSAYIPESVNSIGTYAFNKCYFLKNATYPAAPTIVPDYCFYGCSQLRTFTIPEGITRINEYAFYNCSQFNPRFPSTMTVIGDYAFNGTATDELYVTEDMTVYYQAFGNCKSLVYAEFPTSFATTNFVNSSVRYTDTNNPFPNCTKLKNVYLKSPSVLKGGSYTSFLSGCTNSELTLHVPSFLVNSYKLDQYWYNYNIVGFNTADITDWVIKESLTLNEGERLGGTPSIKILGGGTLTINGDDAMTINNFVTNVNGTYTDQYRAMVISNTNNVSINGTYTYSYKTNEKKWYFITLPFDVKVSNITSPDCSHAVRYYDGATRANNGTGGNWKNYAPTDIIPAGTGFIYQTSKACWSKFVAEDNDTKNYVFSNNEFVKALAANASDVNANKGWNLVGNPWLSYYNIHKLNFTAPITVWNVSKSTYSAYSIIDDDYAILPSEAFFVQCPDEVASISFPIDGRQLTNVIESQNGARGTQASDRKLIDVELSDGEQTDKTRFVLNPQASMAYEVNCDASKFMSMDVHVPQIYTIENGTQMAINERPMGDGTVELGVKVAADGQYTISAPRNQFSSIILYDNETSMQTDLSEGSYTFSANAGTYDNRFVLYVGSSVITNINAMQQDGIEADSYYNLNGQRIGQPQKGLYVVKGKKVIVK